MGSLTAVQRFYFLFAYFTFFAFVSLLSEKDRLLFMCESESVSSSIKACICEFVPHTFPLFLTQWQSQYSHMNLSRGNQLAVYRSSNAITKTFLFFFYFSFPFVLYFHFEMYETNVNPCRTI